MTACALLTSLDFDLRIKSEGRGGFATANPRISIKWGCLRREEFTGRRSVADISGDICSEGVFMSEQGLEVLDSTYQKAQEWIGQLAENAHLEKNDAYKALRAVVLTLRDRLPMEEAVHFGAQLPMLIRGLYYDGWKPSETPVKMSRDQFLEAIEEKIVSERFIDPVRMTHDVFALLQERMSPGEVDNVKQILPKELQRLLPDSADGDGRTNMTSPRQRSAARRNVKKAARTAKRKRTVAHLPKRTRTALGKEGAKAAKKKR
jgi:uncharacterized protein (DUF2267 family)